MIVIDVGNTNTVLGIYNNNKIINKQRVETKNLEIRKNLKFEKMDINKISLNLAC